MGLHQLLAGEVVELGGEPLREAARVHEDQRAAVGAHEVEQCGLHVGPDALGDGKGAVGARHHGSLAARSDCGVGNGAHVAKVVDRDHHLEVEDLRRAGVDDGDGPESVLGPAAEEPRDLVERALRRRQADPLRWARGELLEPFERQCEVGAALGAGDGVDLVDDHRLDVARGPRGPGR